MTTLIEPGKPCRVLAICPHTDDEFGCAGTIIRMLSEGADVHYIALSACEESVPKPLPPSTLRIECGKCVTAMGVPEQNWSVLDYPVRHFPEYRQDILERFVSLAAELNPNLVLVPCSMDTHQDHATVYQEAFRAFKKTTILGYEMPQNLVSFMNSAFVVMSEDVVARKIDSLAQYASQSFRPYSEPEFIRGLARIRGTQCGEGLAEAYEVIRLIL